MATNLVPLPAGWANPSRVGPRGQLGFPALPPDVSGAGNIYLDGGAGYGAGRHCEHPKEQTSHQGESYLEFSLEPSECP